MTDRCKDECRPYVKQYGLRTALRSYRECTEREQRKNECTCGGTTFAFITGKYLDVPDLYECKQCGCTWMMDDDGNLYDPSDPPGPLWSLSLRDYV